MAYYLRRGGEALRYSYTEGILHFPAAFLQLDTDPLPLTRRLCCIVPYVLLADVLCLLVDFWRASPFLQKTLVSSSAELWWIRPGAGFRSSSNFSQDTAMIEPFSEVGMVTQVSAIQSITTTMDRYGRWVTYLMCTPPDVTSEDEERRRVCC